MGNRVAARLSFAKMAVLAVAGVAARAAPFLVGMMQALPILAQAQQSSVPASHAAPPKFEVVSVKSCKGDDLPPGRRRGGNSSPGTLRIDCMTVRNLINQAYILFANGHVNSQPHEPVEGGPGWIDSERYQIDAKAEGPQDQGMMHGPMLQA
ncbi:MAG TPA: TIGR03435 family protein, partial [Bryobacteraceae bacterium]